MIKAIREAGGTQIIQNFGSGILNGSRSNPVPPGYFDWLLPKKGLINGG